MRHIRGDLRQNPTFTNLNPTQMESIFDKANYERLAGRLGRITANAIPGWGKMNAAQMMHHLNLAMEAPLGRFKPKGRPVWVMRIFKSVLYSDKPFSKGSPTPKSFKVTGEFDFDSERQKALDNLREIFQQGLTYDYRHHVFFGKLSAEQWGKHFYKHTDHHLRQFGV